MRVGGLALAGMAAGVCALLLVVGFASAHPAEAERIEILSRRIEAQPGDPRPTAFDEKSGETMRLVREND